MRNLSNSQKSILLSFDVEEFDICGEYGQFLPEREQFRVGMNGLAAILELLDRANVPATLFCTANFARHHIKQIRDAAARHEIASHGDRHVQFEIEDLKRSRLELENIVGRKVRGYRHPRLLALDPRLVREAGYAYNSSENPTWLPGRYNNLNKPRKPRREGDLLQIPLSVTPLIRLPLFWLAFKNIPFALYVVACKSNLLLDGYVILYFHPWEFTDLKSYSLPGIIRAIDGDRLIVRLGKLIDMLKLYGKFVTFSEFDEQFDGI
jgi:hypothetical protein